MVTAAEAFLGPSEIVDTDTFSKMLLTIED